jgi:protein TonB
MRNDILAISLLSSVAIHICVIVLGAGIVHRKQLRRQDFLPIHLVDLARPEAPAPPRESQPEVKKPPPPPPPPSKKMEKPKESPPLSKAPIVTREVPEPPFNPIKEEAAKTVETKPLGPERTETASLVSESQGEAGGSEAGAGNHFDEGDVGIVPGTGTAGGGGGTAPIGLGRGSGAPGLPTSTDPLKTNREARPMRTVRAAYPPMALRAGLESDVILRIEVDTDGNVTRAEITKSGGAGFDEEALKAVQQSRFEPAQRGGQSVPAEFTYIYRFRLQK